MVQLVGFNQPYSMILWQKNLELKSKTVCFSLEEEQIALNRFNTTNDFYNTYEKAIVIHLDKTIEIEKGDEMNVAV